MAAALLSHFSSLPELGELAEYDWWEWLSDRLLRVRKVIISAEPCTAGRDLDRAFVNVYELIICLLTPISDSETGERFGLGWNEVS